MSEDLSAAFTRICDLAIAHGDVPEEGGVDGIRTYEIADDTNDETWFIAITDDEDREYRLPGQDETFSIDAFHAHAWYGFDLIAPAGVLTPHDGQFLVGSEFDRRTEDQLIASIEAELHALGYDDFDAMEVD